MALFIWKIKSFLFNKSSEEGLPLVGEVYYSVFCFFKAKRASAKDDLLLCIFLLLGVFNGLLALVTESPLCCLLKTSLELLLYKE